MFRCLGMTRDYTSVTTRSAAETLQDMPGLHRDPQGRVNDAPDGFTDIADSRGLRIHIFLADARL